MLLEANCACARNDCKNCKSRSYTDHALTTLLFGLYGSGSGIGLSGSVVSVSAIAVVGGFILLLALIKSCKDIVLVCCPVRERLGKELLVACQKQLLTLKVEVDGIVSSLKAAGFDGFLTIEREVGESPEADISMAVNFLREKLEKYSL